MKQTRLIMGMPITIDIVDQTVRLLDIEDVFSYFKAVDNQFSTYKSTSEISLINAGLLREKNYSAGMKHIFSLSEKTKRETNGYFDIFHKGIYDPSGVVKGWAIQTAATLLKEKGFKNFYVDAGGDIQTSGRSEKENSWAVGIRNPFNRNEFVKVVKLRGHAIATSGTAIRGNHIYNPHTDRPPSDITSLSVIAPAILDADRFATAAFAMGREGIHFIQTLKGFEGYMIDKNGIATYTNHFEEYCAN